VRQRRTTQLAYAHHPSPVYGRRAMFAALERLSHQVPGLGLAVFGPGTREEDFLADARALGVEALLEDFGELEHPQTLALISRADAFVRPTTADGDSISVREALALGVPCVASDAAVRPAGAVTYEAGRVEGLADAIQFALSRGPLRTGGPDAGPFLVQLYRDALGEPQQFDGDGVVMAP
jgi:glycosyltransferase involved in cell wall biosynthesis